MADSWTCLMVNKGPGMLNEITKESLIRAACMLACENSDKSLFEDDA